MGIICKLMTGEESLEYRAIRLEALKLYPESFSTRFDEANLNPVLHFEKVLQTSLAGSFVMGAYSKETLIGILAFVDANEQNLPHTGTFLQMYVKKDFQGKGVGLSLTRAAIKQVLEQNLSKSIVLKVGSDNLPAISTYRKAGFAFLPAAPGMAPDNSIMKISLRA